jgi:hypothetical protein
MFELSNAYNNLVMDASVHEMWQAGLKALHITNIVIDSLQSEVHFNFTRKKLLSVLILPGIT